MAMEMEKTHYLVANLELEPRLWNIYNTLEKAESAIPQANEYYLERYGLTMPCKVMSWQEYNQAHDAYWLGFSIQQISSEEFLEMLYCLPPLNWETHEDWESFLMQEFTSGNITRQYIRFGDKYYTKYVNAYERITWLTPEKIIVEE